MRLESYTNMMKRWHNSLRIFLKFEEALEMYDKAIEIDPYKEKGKI